MALTLEQLLHNDAFNIIGTFTAQDNTSETSISVSPTTQAYLALEEQPLSMATEDRLTELESALRKQGEQMTGLQQLLEVLVGRSEQPSAPQDVEEGPPVHDVHQPSPDEAPIAPDLSSDHAQITQVRPSPPDSYDGDRNKGQAFLNSCQLYLSLCSGDFATDQDRIHWVLSFMKADRASHFADRVLRHGAISRRPATGSVMKCTTSWASVMSNPPSWNGRFSAEPWRT